MLDDRDPYYLIPSHYRLTQSVDDLLHGFLVDGHPEKTNASASMPQYTSSD